jgi:hypothetical protein
VTPGGAAAAGGPRSPRSRSGRLTVLAIILFALAFAVGGYFAVKALTAGRGAPPGALPGGEAAAAKED